MDRELLRIKKNNDKNPSNRIKRINEDDMSNILRELNINITELYTMKLNDDIDIDKFASNFAKNIYIILEAFNEMGMFPDCFFDVIIKMNIKYKTFHDNSNRLRGDYKLFDKTGLSHQTDELIKEAIAKGLYRGNNSSQKDISDYYREVSEFFKKFNIPSNIKTNEACKAIFYDLWNNMTNITYRLYISEDLIDDIEYLSRLLFEYLCFFVGMGINPKEYLDAYINTNISEKTK